MKSQLRFLLPLLLAITLALTPACAGQGEFYVKADAGGAVTADTDLREFFGPVTANSKIEFDPGFRLGLRGGYGVTDWFDAEVETGFMANRIDSATGATETDAALINFPLLLNARFHCPVLKQFSPYFGGGFGFSTTVLAADDLVINGLRLDGSAAGIVFAYQAFAGLRYAINDRMGISLEYHYFATSSSEMEADIIGPGVPSDEVRLGGTSSHAVTLAFDYRF